MIPVLNVTDDITHCGHIGHIVKDFEKMCQLASAYGFKGVNIDLQNSSNFSALDKKEILNRYHIKPIAFGFTAEIFNPDESKYEQSVKNFESHLKDAHLIGCNLALCYIPPFSNTLNFNDNFVLASNRLRYLKPLLQKNSIKVGFEFIGPTETREKTKYDFIHTIDGVRALIASADLYGMAGYKLDVHHWQYSGASLLDLKHLELDYILYVEVNDSLEGYDLFTMPEFNRELPFKTGKTDLRGFLKILVEKGYRGPLAVEPWNTTINNLPLEQAVQKIKVSLEECLAFIEQVIFDYTDSINHTGIMSKVAY